MTAVGSEQKAGPAGPPAEAAADPAPPPAATKSDAAKTDGAKTAAPVPEPELGPGAIVSGIGVAVTLFSLLVLGFAGYLYFLSGVQEARAQTGMYATLQGELAKGVAPLSSLTPGAPVAILNIPAIGVHNEVVVEGTTPENLTLGPGHLRDSALPGESGVSVLYGRRASFGAPFARLPQLLPGDTIQATTGQGTASYVVRVVGDSRSRILIDTAPNQLDLLTADSALMPAHYIEVEANLTSTAKENPGGRPAITTSEAALGNDPATLILTMAWGLALLVVSVSGTIAAARWSRWPAYLVTVPIAVAVVWNLYQSVAALLPNLY
jgi:sortase A